MDSREPDPDRDAEPVGATEAAQGAGSRPSAVRRFFLNVVQGPDAGMSFQSEKKRAVVGTDEAADLRLGDRTVSRFHCEIEVVDGRPVIKDLGSKNGTVVNGVSVDRAFLESGQQLQLGRSTVQFELGADHVEIPMSARERFGTMVGRSPAMRATFSLLELAAASEATVLLEGETGTGKEAAAASIHAESRRAAGPFVVVDCGAIPPDLLESELFGHERGAFTGAVAGREGAFEAASGGTIFLDEIGELSLDLQPKLLRVLESREVKRVGANRYLPVDVRVVAATNRNLRAQVNGRQFRSDLYYRLAVVEVRLPPLRERLDDLVLLVESIVDSLGESAPADAELLSAPEFRHQLLRHAWPGNVRELRNYVERCLTLRRPMPLTAADDPAELVDDSKPFKDARNAWERVCERRYLERVLARHGGNVTAAARAAQLDRMYFYRLLWRNRLR